MPISPRYVGALNFFQRISQPESSTEQGEFISGHVIFDDEFFNTPEAAKAYVYALLPALKWVKPATTIFFGNGTEGIDIASGEDYVFNLDHANVIQVYYVTLEEAD